jgi:ABC-2 type transport system permease protein
MNAKHIFAYFPTFARGYLRNPLGLFMALVFPVVLILIFGAVFSNSGSTTVPLTVENLDHNSPASQEFLAGLNATGAVSVTLVSPSVGNLSSYLVQNNLAAGLVIPDGFGANLSSHTPARLLLYTNPSSGSEAGIAQSAVQGVANSMNLRIAGGSALVVSTDVPLGNHLYTSIDYLVPGLIGFSVLVGPMFSVVHISATWKQNKLFRQLSLTPLTRGEWLTAVTLWYIVLALVSTTLLMTVGTLVFGAHVTVPPLAIFFLVVGPILFVGIGLLAGTVASSPETASVIGNIITFPMMFLSGTFFPVTLFPGWLVPIARALPLYYVIDGLNSTMIFGTTSTVWVDMVVVAALSIGIAVAASKAFVWREERGRILRHGRALPKVAPGIPAGQGESP